MELKFEEPKIFETLTPLELAKMSRVTSKNKELSIAIDKFMDGTYSGSDKHYDFFELDMVCPMIVDDPDNKMMIGQATRYESPQNRLRDEPFAGLVEGLIREAMDETAELEKEFMYSVNLQKCDKSVEDKIVELMSRTPLLDDPFMTEKVLRSNRDFISTVYGEAGDEKFADIDAGFTKVEQGSLDADKAVSQNKEYNFNDMLNQESTDEPEEATKSTGAEDATKEPVGVGVGTSAAEVKAETIEII
jgi:hypothetical protein